MEKEKKLKGLNVVYFESRHSKTLGDLIALQGGSPLAAPAMKEVPIENNSEALNFAENLFRKYTSVERLAKANVNDVALIIRRVNFYKGKAKAIKKAADIVQNDYKGKMPETMAELIALPFIGRKTANVILQEAFGKSEGVVVDTHVRRLTNLFGLTKNQDPVKIEKDLMEIIPQKDWREFGLGLIYYGRTYCKASCKHIDCPLREFVV